MRRATYAIVSQRSNQAHNWPVCDDDTNHKARHSRLPTLNTFERHTETSLSARAQLDANGRLCMLHHTQRQIPARPSIHIQHSVFFDHAPYHPYHCTRASTMRVRVCRASAATASTPTQSFAILCPFVAANNGECDGASVDGRLPGLSLTLYTHALSLRDVF